MNKMIWWLDFLSIAMLVATGGCLILMFSDILSVSELLPVQTIAVAAVAAAKGSPGPCEKRRNDKALR